MYVVDSVTGVVLQVVAGLTYGHQVTRVFCAKLAPFTVRVVAVVIPAVVPAGEKLVIVGPPNWI